jgi:hypothetical protein
MSQTGFSTAIRFTAPTSLPEQLWDRAYDMLKDEHGTLLLGYEKVLSHEFNGAYIISADGRYQGRDGLTNIYRGFGEVNSQGSDSLVSSVQDCPIIVNLRRGILVVGREATI